MEKGAIDPRESQVLVRADLGSIHSFTRPRLTSRSAHRQLVKRLRAATRRHPKPRGDGGVKTWRLPPSGGPPSRPSTSRLWRYLEEDGADRGHPRLPGVNRPEDVGRLGGSRRRCSRAGGAQKRSRQSEAEPAGRGRTGGGTGKKKRRNRNGGAGSGTSGPRNGAPNHLNGYVKTVTSDGVLNIPDGYVKTFTRDGAHDTARRRRPQHAPTWPFRAPPWTGCALPGRNSPSVTDEAA